MRKTDVRIRKGSQGYTNLLLQWGLVLFGADFVDYNRIFWVVIMAIIELGSHILTSRIGYTHHGIYAGDGLVIHYSGLSDGLSAGPVEETSLESFLNGQELSVRRYKSPKYVGEAVVMRARSRIGEDNYDLQANNCEHLCSWAVMGKSHSQQVEAVEDFVDSIVPSPFLISIIKARRHAKQGLDPVEIAKDAAEIGVKMAAFATLPVALPGYLAYKAFKWWRK